MNYGTKFCRFSLKLLLPTILTSSVPFYPYQKDERALPGYLLTGCSFSPSDIKRLSLSPQMFSLFFYSYTILSDSLSLFGFSFKGLMLFETVKIDTYATITNHSSPKPIH
jgi:hypothetical protein